jgi:hypothetical protein
MYKEMFTSRRQAFVLGFFILLGERKMKSFLSEWIAYIILMFVVVSTVGAAFAVEEPSTPRIKSVKKSSSCARLRILPMANPKMVSPIPEATIYVSLEEETGSVGEKIEVDIAIENVTDLFAWQAGVTFNPEALACVGQYYDLAVDYEGNVLDFSGLAGMRAGPFLGNAVVEDPLYDDIRTLFCFPHSHASFNNTAGTINYHGCIIFTDPTKQPGASGSGVLATFVFEVIGTGSIDLQLTDILLLDSDGAEMPYNVEYDTFESA